MHITDAFKLADQIVEYAKKQFDITCVRGCNYCCYIPNIITVSEAQWIVNKYGLPSSVKELFNQVIQPETPLIFKDRQVEFCTIVPQKERKCIYLIDGDCSIYEDRPIICRAMMVVSEPKWCSTDHPFKINHNVKELSQDNFFDIIEQVDCRMGLLPDLIYAQIDKAHTPKLLHEELLHEKINEKKSCA